MRYGATRLVRLGLGAGLGGSDYCHLGERNTRSVIYLSEHSYGYHLSA